MKALAILAACLVLSLPAQAFVRVGGGHMGGQPGLRPINPPLRPINPPLRPINSPIAHPGFGWGPDAHHRHDRHPGAGLLLDSGGYYVQPPTETATAPAPEIVVQPVPYCPAPARPKAGPHIIYIGERPAVHGPKIIYGTDPNPPEM